ncbi:hypothetical protein CYMTET_39154 [Cymbomonas tetramitiformis]|uniref:Uncharacterized protein n=1 Tax=Cymbomonas tetramitiformis TaxID=36881 RepID=A0AAE0F4S5_9CHLO|nr:hypothetical protein CYMTET_39154 [Cymbomonas tetramitiformis]
MKTSQTNFQLRSKTQLTKGLTRTTHLSRSSRLPAVPRAEDSVRDAAVAHKMPSKLTSRRSATLNSLGALAFLPVTGCDFVPEGTPCVKLYRPAQEAEQRLLRKLKTEQCSPAKTAGKDSQSQAGGSASS